MMSETIKPEFLTALESEMPKGSISVDEVSLIAYGYDGSTSLTGHPGAVVHISSEEHAQAVMRLAQSYRTPLYPRGAGTGLAGGSTPNGGVVMDFAPMNRVIEIDRECLMAVVEPGVITGDFQTVVEKMGLFYPPDPASLKQCTLGGNVATCAGGPRCLKYGVTREYVRGLHFVVPGGEVIRDGGKYIKSATGYNLSQLFIGSEGTLGVVTEITLRLIPLPETAGTALALFKDLEKSASAVNGLLESGMLPSVIEFVDKTGIDCVQRTWDMGIEADVEAMLLIESDGYSESVRKELDLAKEICHRHGAKRVELAMEKSARDRLWKLRRSISPALSKLMPNKLGEDISVPRSEIIRMVRKIREIASRNDLMIPVFGHIGDGNLHPNVLFDMNDGEMMRRVEKATSELIHAAVSVRGTLSGEHGIGILKKEFLPLAIPSMNMDYYRRIKTLFDPLRIMNPAKIFDM